MRDDLFDELIESIQEAGAILRDEKAPSRSFHIEPLDVKSLRDRIGLSQTEFASVLGISVGTLRNWEQGRRKPQGPAKVLLNIVSNHPEVLLDMVKEEIYMAIGSNVSQIESPQDQNLSR